jgi:hypothetical protein
MKIQARFKHDSSRANRRSPQEQYGSEVGCGSVYREESKEMAATISAGRLDEKRAPSGEQ